MFKSQQNQLSYALLKREIETKLSLMDESDEKMAIIRTLEQIKAVDMPEIQKRELLYAMLHTHFDD